LFQVGTPAAASSRQPESSIQHPAEYLPCSSLALFPFSGPYFSVTSTKACTNTFTFLLFYLGTALSSSPLLQLLRHTALLPTPWATSQTFLPLPSSGSHPAPHHRPTHFPTAAETVSAGSHGTPAMRAKPILLRFERTKCESTCGNKEEFKK